MNDGVGQLLEFAEADSDLCGCFIRHHPKESRNSKGYRFTLRDVLEKTARV
jgi:hypothetical protein